MKDLISIFVIFVFYNNCFSQHSIELKNGTVITNIRINAINNNAVEFEKNKSLHDEFIENIYKISLTKADTIILFDTLKKPIYMRRKPKVLDTTKTVITNNADTIVDYVCDVKKEKINQQKDAITFNISNALNRFNSPILIGYEKRINNRVSAFLEAGPVIAEFFDSPSSNIIGVNARTELFVNHKAKDDEYNSVQLAFANNFESSNYSIAIHGKKGNRKTYKNEYIDWHYGAGIRYHTFSSNYFDYLLIPSFTFGFRLGFHTN